MEIRPDEAAEYLRSHDDYLILTHTRPDGDTLGSAAALCSALRRLGKKAYLYRNRGVTKRFMPYVGPWMEDGSEGTVISVDIAGENLFPDGFKGEVELAIDHHPSNSRFAARTLLEPERAACGEIVLDLIKRLAGGVNKAEADLLYIALSTDTGCFRYANTGADTFRAAAELMDAGADAAAISLIFFRTSSRARLKLEGMVFSSLRTYEDGKVSFAIITRSMMDEAGATENDADDLPSLASRLEGSEVSVTVRETADGKSKVSLRSGDRVNSSQICAHFGGGGHARAAGCTIDCPPDRSAGMLLPLIREALAE